MVAYAALVSLGSRLLEKWQMKLSLIIDDLAGGGGVSTDIGHSFGRPITVAISYDTEDFAMRMANRKLYGHEVLRNVLSKPRRLKIADCHD
jgi:polysaccharide deacetylase 2 family uncharacterized protein YibQ